MAKTAGASQGGEQPPVNPAGDADPAAPADTTGLVGSTDSFGRTTPKEGEDDDEGLYEPAQPPKKIGKAEAEKIRMQRNQAYLQTVKASDVTRKRTTEESSIPPIVRPGENGFPDVHAAHTDSHLENINRDQLEEWLAFPGSGVLTQIMFQNSWKANRIPIIVELVRNIISENFGFSDFLVTPGRPVVMPTREGSAPYTYAILNLSEDEAEELSNQKCLANKTIALTIFPLKYSGPTAYLGTIKGFVNLNVTGTMGRLLTRIKTIWRNSEVYDILIEYAQSRRSPAEDVIMAGAHTEESNIEDINDAESILDTITLYRVENKSQHGVDATALNIYIEMQDPTAEQWNSLKQAIGKVEYGTDFNGYGEFSKGWTCVQCRAIDHPAGLCPFVTDVPEWNEICGINIKTLDAWEAATFPKTNTDSSRRFRGDQTRGNSRPPRGGYQGHRTSRGGGRGYREGAY